MTLLLRICTSPRGAAISLLRWLIGALLPVWLCLGSSLAGAATPAPDAEAEGAPMCDPHAASVAATPEVPEVDHGKLEQLPCDDAWLIWLSNTLEQARGHAAARDGVPASPPPELQVERLRMDGVIPLVLALPGRAEPVRLPRSEVAGLPALPGHRLAVYRPPVRGR